MRHRKRIWLSLMAVLVLVLGACAGDAGTTTTEAEETPTTAAPPETTGTTEAPDETTGTTEAPTETTAANGDVPVVRISALNGGLTGVAAQIVEENGFDEANGYQGEFFYNDPDASGQFFLQRQSDVAFDFDAIGAAIARTEGLDVSVFYPILNNNNCILVKEDAPYETPEDLIGQPVGHFGADSGTTTSFTIVLQSLFDFNLLDEYTLVETGPPALVELLQDDEVEAIFNFVPHSSRAMVQAGARCMFGPLVDVEIPGNAFSHLSQMAAYEDWLADNPELAQAVTASWDDAIDWILEDPTRITQEPYASLLGQDDQAVLDLVAEQVNGIPLFTNDWSPEVQEQAEAWVDLAADQDVLIEENPGGVVTAVGE
ncbi:MAG TPA: ABC transporter substrate-binding protein [Acidimicrobiia bacterium]|nr:ABC transporter substrate-binding protein [Acidimicrobiia bacterium]